jgi:hypothetical protein
MWSEAMRSKNVPKYTLICAIALTAMMSPWDMRRAVADEANPDAAALEKALLDGKDVRMVIDLSACHVHATDTSGPPVKGVRRFDGYMIQSDHTIAFSATHVTVRADKTPVSEFLSYRVHPTGKIDAHTVFLNPTTFAVLHEAEFDCDIGTGATFHW